MGGFDVVALQGICANYFDKHVVPLLRDAEAAHEKLRAEVKELAAAVERKASEAPTTEALDALAADVAQRASLARLEELAAQLEAKAEASATSPELETRLREAEEKSRDAFALAEKLGERQANTERSVRSHAAKLAEIKNFDEELQCKANVRDVPSVQQFQRLKSDVERKANSSKVPSVTQFSELQELVQDKVSAHWVPSLSQFEELAAKVEKKANACGIPSAAELQSMQSELRQKANARDVEEALELKANSGEVPTASSVDQLASVMEKKLAFLAARVQKTGESVENMMSQAMICYIPQQPSPCGTYGGGAWVPVGSGDGYAPGGWGEAATTCTPDSSDHGSGSGSRDQANPSGAAYGVQCAAA